MTPYDLANEFARPAVADLLHSHGEVFNAEHGRNITTSEPMVPINHNSADDMVKSFYAKYISLILLFPHGHLVIAPILL